MEQLSEASRYGTVKRAVRFDDENMSLSMNVKLDSTQWHRLTAQDVLSRPTNVTKPTSSTLAEERKAILLRDTDGEEDE